VIPRAAAAALALASLSGCVALRPEDTGRIADNLLRAALSGELSKTATFSMEQEHHLGKTVAASVVASLGGRALPADHPASVYLRRVGTVVALSAAELRDDESRPYPLRGYRFIAVEATGANAVGTPGGFVVVTTGLLRSARSEDELAAVLAHEVAHVQLGHAVQPVESARRQERLTAVALEGTSDDVHRFFGNVVTAGTDLVLDRGFGKKNELAADAFAARTLREAGYDPAALTAFLSRLDGRSAQGGFLARHPPAAERVAALGGAAPPAAPAPIRITRLTRAVATIGP
jgi:predicted Zn-dependent protease